MPVVITAYDAPSDSEVAQLQASATQARAVYRSTDDAAAFGVITLSRHTDLDEAVRVALVDTAESPSAVVGVYREHDIGAQPAGEAPDDSNVVTFINCLRVKPGHEDEAFATWKRVNDYMVAKSGYLSHALYRRLRPTTSFAFVNVVRWTTAESLRAAQDDGFRELTRNLPFVAHPSLCRQVGEPALPAAR
jgi:heme-degrading monooxygenase HmoA